MVSGDSDPAAEPAPHVAEEHTAQPDQRTFTPPPVSVEDLATVSSLPRLGLGRLRGR